MKLCGLSPNSSNVSVSDLYIPTISLPIVLQENRSGPIAKIYRSLTDTRYMNVEIGTEAVQFLFWENITRIFFVVYISTVYCRPICITEGVDLASMCFRQRLTWWALTFLQATTNSLQMFPDISQNLFIFVTKIELV
jgi:hypothetical protein